MLFFDDNGTHSAMSAAEMIARVRARAGDRHAGADSSAPRSAGSTTCRTPRAFNETDTRITINSRVLAVRRDGDELCAEIGSDYSAHRTMRHVDQVVVDYGTAPIDELYFELQAVVDEPRRRRLRRADRRPAADAARAIPSGTFQLFRIGDAVAGRNIHAAVYDALRLVKDL